MAVLTAAGALALTSLTGCTSFDNDDAVATVGKEEIPAGVANFYARMQQAQYETCLLYTSFGLDHPDGEEKTQKEVADYLGISQSYISRLEKKIMQRLKREMVRYE